ncbi:hypothetical protein Pmar_PMAR002659, partial [Perkinsus marinus ATCC 50983]
LEDPRASRGCRVGRQKISTAAAAADVDERISVAAKRFHIQLYLDLYRCGISSLESRFLNEQFNRVMKLEKLLICNDPGPWKEECILMAKEDYDDDIDLPRLRRELETFHDNLSDRKVQLHNLDDVQRWLQ